MPDGPQGPPGTGWLTPRTLIRYSCPPDQAASPCAPCCCELSSSGHRRCSASHGRSVPALVGVVAELNTQIARLKAELSEGFDRHQDAKIVRSLPGASDSTGHPGCSVSPMTTRTATSGAGKNPQPPPGRSKPGSLIRGSLVRAASKRLTELRGSARWPRRRPDPSVLPAGLSTALSYRQYVSDQVLISRKAGFPPGPHHRERPTP
jgi:hypothetical protein